MCFVILWFSVSCLFVFSSTRNASFLYGDRPVSLRWSPCFSTSLSPLVFNILHPLFSLPASSFLFCQNLSRFILSISFFLFPFYPSSFFSSLAHSYARVYIIMCLLFSSFSLPFIFMFYNTFANQRLTKKFSFYSKIIPDIFCLYCKKVYFCIRLARGAKLLSLTWLKARIAG